MRQAAFLRTHFLALFRFDLEWEKVISLRMLSKDVHLDSIFDFLKEINVFNRL